MVKIGQYEIVNPQHVVHARIDNHGDTSLIIELDTGREIRVRHTAGCYDGVDVYTVLRQIESATVR